MRKLNYEVKKADGSTFHTASYTLAKQSGNRIVNTYLTWVDEQTEEEKEKNREHAKKVREFLKKEKAKRF